MKTIKLNNKEEIDEFCFKHKDDGVVFGKTRFSDDAYNVNGEKFDTFVNYAAQNMKTKETLYYDWVEIK